MVFVDDNFACSMILHENGTHGMKLEWNCLPEKKYSVEGFLICYMIGDSAEKCQEVVSAMDDQILLQKIKNNEWIYNDENDRNHKVASISRITMPEGFSVLNQVFRAPCKIEIWTVCTTNENSQVVVMNRSKSDCICYRKLFLKKEVHITQVPAVMGGLFRRRILKPASTVIEFTISSIDSNASYKDGAVGYMVPGCRYMFPLAKETLGRKIRLSGFTQVEIVINNEFGKLYEFIN